MICDIELLYSTLCSELSFSSDSPDASVRQFAASALKASFLKKFVERTSVTADSLAINKFIECNEQCRMFDLRPSSSLDELLIGQLKKNLWDFFNPNGYLLDLSPSAIFSLCGVGPGSSVGAKGTDFYTKLFSSDLTFTHQSIYDWYKLLTNLDPVWSSAENVRSSLGFKAKLVEGSNLSCVPKTRKISRSICTEPTLNMFFQIGLGRAIEKRLKSFFSINLSQQPSINRDFAKLGSVTGDYSTIDLSSASDTISLNLLSKILPKAIYETLMRFRSPKVKINGEFNELFMISSMGNGFTFPLETAIFAAIARSSAQIAGCKGYTSAFGDDIIVPTGAFRFATRLLKLCGFSVNEDKSYHEGSFRESCGGDYLNGHSVRGVYIKKLQTPQDYAIAINRLNEWSAITGISLPLTVRYLLSFVKAPEVPLFESLDSGIRVPSSDTCKRYCAHLFGSFRYSKWQAQPVTLLVKEQCVVSPKNERFRSFNPPATLLALLHGSLRRSRISIRSTRVRYRLKKSITPCWDYILPEQALTGLSVARLIRACRTNFGPAFWG